MPVISIDTDNPEHIKTLRRLIDPTGRLDLDVYTSGLARFGTTVVVTREPEYVGAQVTDRWGRVWERISDHVDGIWACDDPRMFAGLDDFVSISHSYGPLTQERPARSQPSG